MQFISDITVRPIQQMGGDHMVVAAAKVSTNGVEAEAFADALANNPEALEAGKGLINYLMEHRHGTPFEHSSLTMFVHAPILVWREWHRHRIGFSYNEESGRYKTLDPVFYIPDQLRPMFKVDGWKPGRPKFTSIRVGEHGAANDEDWAKYEQLCDNLKRSYTLSYEMYEANLALGIDPGLARDCLPVGIYSACWVTCNPRSLMAFLSLRVHDPEATFVSYPLWEIDMAARAAEEILKEGWPITYAAFVANGRVAP